MPRATSKDGRSAAPPAAGCAPPPDGPEETEISKDAGASHDSEASGEDAGQELIAQEEKVNA
jgi:hypothetical protein